MAEEYYSKWTGEEIDNGIEKALESIDDKTPTFIEAADRTNIASGEKISVIFGKVKKWFTDLNKVAFSGSYTDLNNTPKIFSGDYDDLSNKPIIPTTLPNPQSLTFTGGSNVSYDGSSDISVEIPTLSSLGAQKEHDPLSLTLEADGWGSSNTYTITANGVTETNTIIVGPDPVSFNDYTEANVRCTEQAENSLTFAADEKPITELIVNVIIFNK